LRCIFVAIIQSALYMYTSVRCNCAFGGGAAPGDCVYVCSEIDARVCMCAMDAERIASHRSCSSQLAKKPYQS